MNFSRKIDGHIAKELGLELQKVAKADYLRHGGNKNHLSH
jgi:hypothetical protein